MSKTSILVPFSFYTYRKLTEISDHSSGVVTFFTNLLRESLAPQLPSSMKEAGEPAPPSASEMDRVVVLDEFPGQARRKCYNLFNYLVGSQKARLKASGYPQGWERRTAPR